MGGFRFPGLDNVIPADDVCGTCRHQLETEGYHCTCEGCGFCSYCYELGIEASIMEGLAGTWPIRDVIEKKIARIERYCIIARGNGEETLSYKMCLMHLKIDDVFYSMLFASSKKEYANALEFKNHRNDLIITMVLDLVTCPFVRLAEVPIIYHYNYTYYLVICVILAISWLFYHNYTQVTSLH